MPWSVCCLLLCPSWRLMWWYTPDKWIDELLSAQFPRRWCGEGGTLLGVPAGEEHQLCELNYHDQKIPRTPTHDIGEHWTAVSTLLDFISNGYRNFHHWRSNQRLQTAVPKFYNWAISSYRTQVTPNQLVRYEQVAQL